MLKQLQLLMCAGVGIATYIIVCIAVQLATTSHVYQRERESVGIATSSVFANRSWADCCECGDCCDYRPPTGLAHIL